MSRADERRAHAVTLTFALLLVLGCHTHLQSASSLSDAGASDAGDGGAADGAARNPPSDAASDAGNASADAGASTDDPPIAQTGDACFTADRRACAGADSKLPLVCRAGMWQPDSPCDDEARCDTTEGEQRGRCKPVARTFSSGHLSGNETATCAIDDAGEMFCWGPEIGSVSASSDPAQLIAASNPMRFGSDHWREVAVGAFHACAIRDNGALVCWGRNCAGQLGDNTRAVHSAPVRVGDASNWQHVAVGGGHSCAIDSDGLLSCWGGADHAQADCSMTMSQPPTKIAGEWLQVSIHVDSIYGLKQDGSLWRIWDEVGTSEQPIPDRAMSRIGSASWHVIAAGVGSVCGIRSDGSLACAGDDESEETSVGTKSGWGAAIAARDHFCAIKQDATLWCWGRNDNGQLGTRTLGDDVAEPTQVGRDSGWVAVSANHTGSCGVRDGEIYCWGSNRYGNLGIGDVPFRPAPARVGSASEWSAPSVGDGFSCALQKRALECWGTNASGTFGTSKPSIQLAPTTIAGTWYAAQASGSSACAIDDSATLWCWGDGSQALTKLLAGMTFSALGRGARPCALADDASAWCWPDGAAVTTTPQPEVPNSNIQWLALASSGGHRCGIAADGTLYCWGRSLRGEIGIGTIGASESVPTAVHGAEKWLAVSVAIATGIAANANDGLIATDSGYSCGITDEGTGGGGLFCWGFGGLGLLGDGGEQDSLTPQQVGSASDWTAVSTGGRHACAINAAGELWCWGRNDDGGLGIGAVDAEIHRPERVGPEHTWSGVDVLAHSCATTDDGELYCWGSDGSGALGDGTAWRLEPTRIAL